MTALIWTVFNEIEVLIGVLIVLTGLLLVMMFLMYGEMRGVRRSILAQPGQAHGARATTRNNGYMADAGSEATSIRRERPKNRGLARSAEPEWGAIEFGMSYGEDAAFGLRVHGSRKNFAAGEPVVWVAYLSEQIGSGQFTRMVSRVENDGSLTVISNQTIFEDPESDVVGDQLAGADLATLGMVRSGTYRVGYDRGNMHLAQGTFKVG
jgi:hypothetical protein